jgi:3-dehydroquinate dehydratase-1
VANWHLGTRALGDTPTIIVAARDDVSADELQGALNAGAHAIELRIDHFRELGSNYVVEQVRRLAVGPTLATIRHAREGGQWQADEAARLALYRAVLPLVQGVDCELSAAETCETLFAEARAVGKLTVGSFHDFNACPDDATLDALIPVGDRAGADVVKVAAHCETLHDLRRLAGFTLRHAGRGVVAIGMGPAGTASRVFFPALGSLLTFTFLGEPTAPGQLNCTALVSYLTGLYPQTDRTPQ